MDFQNILKMIIYLAILSKLFIKNKKDINRFSTSNINLINIINLSFYETSSIKLKINKTTDIDLALRYSSKFLILGSFDSQCYTIEIFYDCLNLNKNHEQMSLKYLPKKRLHTWLITNHSIMYN